MHYRASSGLLREYLFRNGVLRRCLFGTTVPKRISQVEEVKVPVPWGYVTGKWWGSKDVEPMIAVHGWLDNAGSWDYLAQELPNDCAVLALDLPGSGLSYHLPKMHNYHFSATTALLRRIQKHFGIERPIMLGHSGGSAACFLFTSVFSDCVKAYIAVDYLMYAYRRVSERANNTGPVLDRLLEVGARDPRGGRIYDQAGARAAWVAGSLLGAVTPHLVEPLLPRATMKVEEGVRLTHDQRLKLLQAVSVDCFSIEQAEAIADNIKCHVCLIEAEDSPFVKLGLRNHPGTVDRLRAAAKSFSHHRVPGHHHIHLEKPKEVAAIIKEFLCKVD